MMPKTKVPKIRPVENYSNRPDLKRLQLDQCSELLTVSDYPEVP